MSATEYLTKTAITMADIFRSTLNCFIIFTIKLQSYTTSEIYVNVCLLSPLKRRNVRWRNFACGRVPSVFRTWAGSYVDRGHHWGENEIFKTLHFKLCNNKQQQQGDAHVGRSERLSPSTSSQPTGTDKTGSCCSSTAAQLAITRATASTQPGGGSGAEHRRIRLAV